MPEKIVMPKLGMVMSEGAISKFLKNKGDAVSQGDVIAQIETEKINYDLENQHPPNLYKISQKEIK